MYYNTYFYTRVVIHIYVVWNKFYSFANYSYLNHLADFDDFEYVTGVMILNNFFLYV